jgi:hypothetical protein
VIVRLFTSRDRVEKFKSAGKSAEEAIAEKPFAEPIREKLELIQSTRIRAIWCAIRECWYCLKSVGKHSLFCTASRFQAAARILAALRATRL